MNPPTDHPLPRPLARLLIALAGAILGLLLGAAVTLGWIVYEAHFHHAYLESTDDLLGPRGIAIPLGLLAGAIAGWAAPGIMARAMAGALAIGVASGAAGWVVGGQAASGPSGPWAGAVMGSAGGILLGIAAGAMLARRRRRRAPRSRRAQVSGVFFALGCLAAVASCGRDPPPPPDVPPAPAPGAEPVESVILSFGDPGRARYLHFPVLPKLAQEVEFWSARLERDSAVVVLALGDIVYPDGMHPPGSEGYPMDSARVASHLEIVAGETARERRAHMYFVAGNHDWGLMEDRRGARRLRNLGRFLDRAGLRGVRAALVPEAGTGMPYVVDLGENLRLILLDTAWWIFDAEPERKAEMVERLATAIAGAGGREVVIAAHHPYETAGPHGGEVTAWKMLGIRQLLARSGAMLQSLDSRPYRDLRAAMEDVFAEVGRPLAFLGGHEHSLQVIQHDSATAPRYSLVSGSASKLTGVGWVDGMLYGRSAPGYMLLLVRESGAVDLYVEATREEFVLCDGEPGQPAWEECMREGIRAYDTVFSMRLTDAGRRAPTTR